MSASTALDYRGHALPSFSDMARSPLGHAPLRRPGSVRRTMSIDVTWPDGSAGVGVYVGRARDILTSLSGPEPIVLAEDRLEAVADNRTIVSAESDPPRSSLEQLAGVRAGGRLRAAVERALPNEKLAGTPLYLLLDDMAGATLVSQWPLSVWGDWSSQPEDRRAANDRSMKGVCIGFRPGSSALGDGGKAEPPQNSTAVLPLARPDDPQGWHEMPAHQQLNFRRARRIDVWRDGELLRIDSMFQDSASRGGGERVAVHEYSLTATADARSRTLLSIEAVPGTLPFRECQAAPVNLSTLLGSSLAEMRETVLERLPGTAGCTHLNDAVRALAEVSVLAAALR